MKLKVFASGSAGNCYLLESDNCKLLIECGIQFKRLKQAMNFDFSGVCGCLVTHAHQDHCKAIHDVMSAGIDVYASKGTKEALGINHYRYNVIELKKQFTVGDFIILPFDTQHDCEGSLGFLIQYKPTGEKLLFATDTYYLKYRFKGLNYIMIECNFDDDTVRHNVDSGLVHSAMKNRLIESHFSLKHVKEFLQANDLSTIRKIILIHLSDSNSDAKKIANEIQSMTGIDTVIADVGMEIELDWCPF